MFKYFAMIRNNQTGEVRKRYEPDWMDFTEGTLFFWKDGNFGCDCNRSDSFCRAANEPEDVDAPCGSDKFSVNLHRADNSEIIYQEFQE